MHFRSSSVFFACLSLAIVPRRILFFTSCQATLEKPWVVLATYVRGIAYIVTYLYVVVCYGARRDTVASQPTEYAQSRHFAVDWRDEKAVQPQSVVDNSEGVGDVVG